MPGLTYPDCDGPEPQPCIACGDWARHMEDVYCKRCASDEYPSTVGPK